MVDKSGVAFLEEDFYEEIVAEEEVVGETEVITDHYVNDDGTLITGHLDGGLMTLSDPNVQHHSLNNNTLATVLEEPQRPVIDQQPVATIEDQQSLVDPFPRPKHGELSEFTTFALFISKKKINSRSKFDIRFRKMSL